MLPSQTTTAPATAPDADHSGLDFHRCRWCGTPAYRRLLCPSCASPDLEPAHGDGAGVLTRRLGREDAVLVQMNEGLALAGRLVGTHPRTAYPGAPLRLVPSPDPHHGEPTFELLDAER
ncbi:hypothetical protein [Streptacidiphilus sp. EB129]|uniref:hypothetical protein n=1 Tax=Streptacidiphilus sp. EB129 TaxID=3156262 RepID=UPI003518E501